MIKLVCISIILIAFSAYTLRFGLDFLSTQEADVWGQFGDFMGGVLNPILSFISICLLIKSVSLQVGANKALSKEINRQERIENYKRFEIRFFSLIEAQDSNFNKFRILIQEELSADEDINDESKLKFEPVANEFKAGSAVGYIDDCLSVLVQSGIEKERIISWLEDLDVDDNCFSLVRRFYLLVKLIKEKAGESEQDEHLSLLIHLTDEKLLTIIAILCELYDWKNIEYIQSSGILKVAGVDNYMRNYLAQR